MRPLQVLGHWKVPGSRNFCGTCRGSWFTFTWVRFLERFLGWKRAANWSQEGILPLLNNVLWEILLFTEGKSAFGLSSGNQCNQLQINILHYIDAKVKYWLIAFLLIYLQRCPRWTYSIDHRHLNRSGKAEPLVVSTVNQYCLTLYITVGSYHPGVLGPFQHRLMTFLTAQLF